MLTQGGGSGSDHVVELGFFLSPVPPAGPLTIHLRCQELGIEQASVTVDATPIVAALPGVVELWPWEPESPLPQPPEPPTVPPGSWFAGAP